MPKPNIPIVSKKWHTDRRYPPDSCRELGYNFKTEIMMSAYDNEEDMPHSIRTNISVTHIRALETFAKANDLASLRLGVWKDVDRALSFIIQNKICYLLLSPTDAEEANLIYMNLKYGSFENAFTHFLKTIGNH